MAIIIVGICGGTVVNWEENNQQKNDEAIIGFVIFYHNSFDKL
jgi:hypothetical protein